MSETFGPYGSKKYYILCIYEVKNEINMKLQIDKVENERAVDINNDI